MPVLDARRSRRVVAGAMVVGIVLRLAFAVGYWRGKPMTHDEQEYLVLAENLAAGRGFSRELPGAFQGPSVERFARAPLYPLFVAAVLAATGHPTDRLPSEVPRALQIVQAALGAWTIWIISRFAAGMAGPAAGAIAAVLAAVHPPLVWMSAYALSEVLYAPLVLAAALLLDRAAGWAVNGTAADGRGVGRAAAAGAMVGLGALVRSAALVFVPLAAAALLWRRRPALAVAMVLAAAAVVSPWTLRNYLVHQRLIVVAADGGVTFWTGNHPLARGEGDLAANPQLKRAQREFLVSHRGLSPEALEPVYYRDALAFIADHPGEWLWLEAKKLFYTFVPIGPSYRLHSRLYYWGSVVPYLLLLPFAFAGVRLAIRLGRAPWGLFLLAASQIAVCLLFFPQERFRMPVIDPTLIACAAVSLRSWRAVGGLLGA